MEIERGESTIPLIPHKLGYSRYARVPFGKRALNRGLGPASCNVHGYPERIRDRSASVQTYLIW